MQIRRGVFETNSSSMHSITIADSGDLMDTLPMSDGEVFIPAFEFGWERETYGCAISKASYMYVYARDWGRNRKDEFLDTLEQVIKDQTGCDSVVFDLSQDGYGSKEGYIDHQSVEDSDYDYLFEDREKLRQFIFNPKSVLVTDNDNH